MNGSVNEEMKRFALEFKDECTKRGYTTSICLADGLGHGEFYNNIEEVEYSMIRFIEKKGKTAIHFKSHMQSKPVETNMSFNALTVISDLTSMNAMNFIECLKGIEERIEVHKEKSKIIPFNKSK